MSLYITHTRPLPFYLWTFLCSWDKDQARPQVLTYQWEWRGMQLSKLNNLLKWCSNLLQVDRVNVISVTEPHRHLLIMKSKNSLISNANRIAFLFSLTLFNVCLMTMTPWKVRDLWICINWCWLVCFHFHLLFFGFTLLLLWFLLSPLFTFVNFCHLVVAHCFHSLCTQLYLKATRHIFL